MAEWICETCVHYPPSSFGGKPCAMCNPDDPMFDHYAKWEETPPTNADRIRAMSEEELASWIWNVQLGLPRTMGDISDWLRSPVDGGDGE